MKHLEPLMTYLSPFLTAVVFMPETSEPASGSVRQKDASLRLLGEHAEVLLLDLLGAAEHRSGAVARPLHISEVPMPEQPQPSSSSIRQPVR